MPFQNSLNNMKNIIIAILFATAASAFSQNTIAWPKWVGQANQVQGASTDVGGGVQAPTLATTAAPSTSTTPATNAQAIKAVTTAGTPVQLVATSTLVDAVEIFARKNSTTANTGNVYVGFSSTGGQNFRVLAPGETFSEKAPDGKKIDLSLIYIDAATNADAVIYTSIN
jgi:hypothetical protein